jgi:hypothetical protein
MRIEVYNATTLAAVLEYRRVPIYHGTLGQEVKKLVEARRCIRNPWTGEQADVPRDDSPGWWVATILYAGLGGAGFHVVLSDVSLLTQGPQSTQG